jgi:hypothetical protein
MDDIVILHSDKEVLREFLAKIKQYLSEELDLKVKSNWQIFPTSVRGIDFVGYRHFYGYKLLRKGTCKRFKRKLKGLLKKQKEGKLFNYTEWCGVNSYNGWLKWCNSLRLRKKYVLPVVESLVRYYKDIILKDIKNWEKRLKKYSEVFYEGYGNCIWG